MIIDSSLRMIDVLVINRSGPWKGGRGAGRARRSLSVIQNFKMSCRGQFNKTDFFFGRPRARDEAIKLLELTEDIYYNVL